MVGFFSDKWEETARRLEAELEPRLRPGEELIGAILVNQQRKFSANLYAIGVTADRLIVLPLDRKMKASGDPESVTRDDVTGSAIWGWGGSIKDFLDVSADQELRFETATEKYKFMTLGGNILENSMSGDGQLRGLDAVIEFLQSAKR
jgi:hypothetical protein